MDEVERVHAMVRAATAVTVLTGAGISTDSGIPDFRGPKGVWTLNPAAERLSSYDDYVRDPEVRRRAWQARKTHPAWTAEPNDGHRALVALERAGKLRGLPTQNIDGLHQRAGSSPELVIELHGTIWQVECLSCGARTAMADQLARVTDAEPDPPCATTSTPATLPPSRIRIASSRWRFSGAAAWAGCTALTIGRPRPKSR